MKVLRIDRRRLIFCVMPVIILLTAFVAYDADTDLSGKVIVVDAGHGGVDSGANRPGVLEKDINLTVSAYLKEALNQYGAKVILSREADTELSGECDNEKVKGRYRRDLMARLELVEESDADAFVSIHANSGAKTKHGAEVFYYWKSEAGKALAMSIQAELCKLTQVQTKANPGDYFVLRRNTIPAALVEVGYITHPEERVLLLNTDYQKQLAKAVAQGIRNYYLYSK